MQSLATEHDGGSGPAPRGSPVHVQDRESIIGAEEEEKEAQGGGNKETFLSDWAARGWLLVQSGHAHWRKVDQFIYPTVPVRSSEEGKQRVFSCRVEGVSWTALS